jgi:hypothetical protein
MISLGWLVIMHPFHLSLTEINYNPKSQKLEISQKIFWDDLEIALSKFHDESIDFLNPTTKEILTKQVKSYLLAHNSIWIEGKLIPLSLLGFEVEQDAAWFYLESAKTQRPNSIKISSSILVEDFANQKNVVQYYFEAHKPKSLILGKGCETGTLDR